MYTTKTTAKYSQAALNKSCMRRFDRWVGFALSVIKGMNTERRQTVATYSAQPNKLNAPEPYQPTIFLYGSPSLSVGRSGRPL